MLTGKGGACQVFHRGGGTNGKGLVLRKPAELRPDFFDSRRRQREPTKGVAQFLAFRPQPAGASGLHTIIADVESLG